jgi:riboflavin synthase
MGEISKITDTGNSYIFRIKYSKNIQKYLAFKGSITINGVSLTISKLEALHLEVSIIPHTFKTTTFHRLKTGDKVNLEIDLIARYLDNLLEKQKDQASYNFLKERNLI